MSTKVLTYTRDCIYLSDPALPFDYDGSLDRRVDKRLSFRSGVLKLKLYHYVFENCVFSTGEENKIEANSTKILEFLETPSALNNLVYTSLEELTRLCIK